MNWPFTREILDTYWKMILKSTYLTQFPTVASLAIMLEEPFSILVNKLPISIYSIILTLKNLTTNESIIQIVYTTNTHFEHIKTSDNHHWGKTRELDLKKGVFWKAIYKSFWIVTIWTPFSFIFYHLCITKSCFLILQESPFYFW